MAPATYFYGHGMTTSLNRHFYNIFTKPLTSLSFFLSMIESSLITTKKWPIKCILKVNLLFWLK